MLSIGTVKWFNAQKGFGFITDGDGKRLETVEQVEAGKRITVRVKDGRIGAVVDHVEKYQ